MNDTNLHRLSRAIAGATLLAVAGAASVATSTAASASEIVEGASSSNPVERGRYLVTVLGCHDCHTPLKLGPDGPAPDMSRMLSGHPDSLVMPPPPTLPEGPWTVVAAGTSTAWSGPWGVSFTANLTPDAETGLGTWSWENFRDTIRTGRHLGRGRPILPPMPIPMYRNLTDEDLRAVFSYLQSIPPIDNRVPEPLPPAAAGTAPGAG